MLLSHIFCLFLHLLFICITQIQYILHTFTHSHLAFLRDCSRTTFVKLENIVIAPVNVRVSISWWSEVSFSKCKVCWYFTKTGQLYLPAATKLWPRLCFYSCLWFCPRGGVCLSACWDTTSPREQTPPWSRHPPGSRHPLEQIHPPSILSMSGRYASYWNAFLILYEDWTIIFMNMFMTLFPFLRELIQYCKIIQLMIQVSY